ncbi:MAG: DUF72 domain-containing protein [Solirubrobacterales bacterium]
MGAIVVGTSSWADPGFVKHWYPKGMAARERLGFYAERFEVVELNSSFYATPSRDSVERWAEVTPDGFRFHVKLHRLLSRHATKPDALPPDLRDGLELNSRGNVIPDAGLEQAMVERMVEAMQPLADAGKLGAFLLQLSPAFRPRDHELAELDPIIEALAPHPLAVEFRYRAWMKEKRRNDVFSYLSDRDAVYVSVDAPLADHVPIMPPIDAVTSRRLAYLRCHGRNERGYMSGRTVAERFDYDYSDEELEEIADRARALADDADEAHVLFNNNARELAPKAARRMRQLVGQDPGPEP